MAWSTLIARSRNLGSTLRNRILRCANHPARQPNRLIFDEGVKSANDLQEKITKYFQSSFASGVTFAKKYSDIWVVMLIVPASLATGYDTWSNHLKEITTSEKSKAKISSVVMFPQTPSLVNLKTTIPSKLGSNAELFDEDDDTERPCVSSCKNDEEESQSTVACSSPLVLTDGENEGDGILIPEIVSQTGITDIPQNIGGEENKPDAKTKIDDFVGKRRRRHSKSTNDDEE